MIKNNSIEYIYLNKFPKNFLIFLPMVFSYNISYDNFQNCFLGFIIFSIIANVCYLTNNYVDQKIDKFNKLKKKNKPISKKKLIFLNCLIIFFIFTLYFSNFFSWLLFLYLFLFYLYTFFLKKVFLIDILALSIFYLIRIYYGSDIINQNISIGFTIFFFSLFVTLAIYKRIIQINVNNLKNKNSIIAYTIKELSFLKYFSDVFILVSIILLSNFLIIRSTLFNFFFEFNFSGSRVVGSIILILFLFNFYRIRKLVFFNKIQKDIVDYVLTDKYAILTSIFISAILINLYL